MMLLGVVILFVLGMINNEGNSWPGNKEVLTPGKRKKKVSRTGVRSGVLKPLVRSGVRGEM